MTAGADIDGAPTAQGANAPVLVLSDRRAGHDAIAKGVAQALGLPFAVRIMPPFRLLAPRPAPPFPLLAIAAGRRGHLALARLKRAHPAIYAIACLKPRSALHRFDFVWTPAHDGPPANGLATLLSPHRFSPKVLAAVPLPAEIAALLRPRLAVLLGGPGAGYRYDAATHRALIAACHDLAQTHTLMLTPSRRTPPVLTNALAEALPPPHFIWRGEGENPYPALLAAADAFLITADSVNMAGEAAAGGRPIHIFHPPGGRAKFHTFHAGLEAAGIARRYVPGAPLPHWPTQSHFVAPEIAAAIRAACPQLPPPLLPPATPCPT